MLESRLDNSVYRFGLAPTRSSARQLVTHRHFLVNNRIVNILKEDEIFMKKMKSISRIWRKGDIDIIRKLFIEIYESSQYSKYLNNNENHLFNYYH